MSPLRRGALIVIEGVDRSGKSTQCRKLVQSLKAQNIKAELMNFPDRTTLIGKLISEYLQNKNCRLDDHAIHLLFAANRWEKAEEIKSLISEGTTLIVDRYSYSGIAFSSAKGVPGMDLNWCKGPEIGLPKPDQVFLLTLNPREAAKRSGFGEERYENEAMQNSVSKRFSQLFNGDSEDNWESVDASGTVEIVQATLLQKVLRKIGEVQNKPLSVLEFNVSV
ncbi:thymidylate kinase [Anthonomus grandis grandis]|uniref:thymidylate kinase n=1 Tax=Anthonomus grandis grandis TaxID=2921223 RepID=UPI002165343C|nr:thymidylate kinase [Anthonomus grandis grandis]